MGSSMTRYGHVAWRVIAVMAFAGTAALAVTLTRVPAPADHLALSSNLIRAAIRDTSIRPRPVMLAPGATAHSVLRVTGTGRFRPTACAQVTAPELRVMPPEADRPAFVPIRLPACSRKGPKFLSVQAIQPRPGIPGLPVP
jgi:Protein of unknown function (DUF4232)